MSYPISATIWPDEFVWSVGTGPVPFKTDNALYNGFSYASTHANGDTCKAQFFLKAGTYTLHQLGILDPAAGIVVWYVDGVAQGSGQNWYAGSLTYNVLKTVGITVIGDGPHELMGVLTGKDGSSTSYYLELIKLWIQ